MYVAVFVFAVAMVFVAYVRIKDAAKDSPAPVRPVRETKDPTK